MPELGIAGGVLGFWLLIVWRVRVERGWVGVSAALRLRLAFEVALTPAIREATAKMAAFADAWERSSGSDDA